MDIQELRDKYIDERAQLEKLQEKTVERLVFIEGALQALFEVKVMENEKDTPNG